MNFIKIPNENLWINLDNVLSVELLKTEIKFKFGQDNNISIFFEKEKDAKKYLNNEIGIFVKGGII